MSTLPPLYLITDRHQIRSGKSFLDVLEELLRGGVKMLQLREKDLSAAELLPLALQTRELTNSYNCQLLINDRIDVALAVNADGVHLGGHSLTPAVARELLGSEKLIGVSTHSFDELASAVRQGADFVTFGPVFHTASKAAYGDPVGLENLRLAVASCDLPIYALGGINTGNADSILPTDAHGIALISALLNVDSPAENCQKLLKILSN